MGWMIGIRFLAGAGIFLSLPLQPHWHWSPPSLLFLFNGFLQAKWPGCEVDHSPPSRSVV